MAWGRQHAGSALSSLGLIQDNLSLYMQWRSNTSVVDSVGDPYLWVKNPAPDLSPDPDPTLDPTNFFSDFKDAKKIFFIFHAGSALSSLGLIQDNGVAPVLWTVLRIHDILVRIRICGSTSLTKESCSRSVSRSGSNSVQVQHCLP